MSPPGATPPRTTTTRLILGLDPGTAVTGWGFVERTGSRCHARGHGAWRTRPEDGLPHRLAHLADRLAALLAETRPDVIAIEQAFQGRNVQSAFRLGEARGALLATCARADVAVVEYSTATVKKAVAGSGRADKTQVQFMLQRLLALASPPSPLDASDALALALTLAQDRLAIEAALGLGHSRRSKR